MGEMGMRRGKGGRSMIAPTGAEGDGRMADGHPYGVRMWNWLVGGVKTVALRVRGIIGRAEVEAGGGRQIAAISSSGAARHLPQRERFWWRGIDGERRWMG